MTQRLYICGPVRRKTAPPPTWPPAPAGRSLYSRGATSLHCQGPLYSEGATAPPWGQRFEKAVSPTRASWGPTHAPSRGLRLRLSWLGWQHAPSRGLRLLSELARLARRIALLVAAFGARPRASARLPSERRAAVTRAETKTVRRGPAPAPAALHPSQLDDYDLL